jgi:hypothetical protein
MTAQARLGDRWAIETIAPPRRGFAPSAIERIPRPGHRAEKPPRTPCVVTGMRRANEGGVAFCWEDLMTRRIGPWSTVCVAAASVAGVYGCRASLHEQASSEQQGSTACSPVSIASVSASAEETPNVAENAIDRDLSTRWSALGKGQYLTADLGSVQSICAFAVAWYRGDQRKSKFDIGVSTDDTTYTKEFSGQSSGKTVQLESYTLGQTVDARYVRFTVNGNTQNDWASISEIGVSAGGSAIDAGTGVDMWGITELYPSKPGGESWFMTSDPNKDPRAGIGEHPRPSFTQNQDGSWKVQGVKGSGGDIEVRWGIVTSSGYDESQIQSLDQQDLANQGYMLHPNDWRNIEMTGYYRINSHDSSTSNGEAHIEDVLRGGRSTSDSSTVGGYPASCEATSYHSNTYPITGRAKFEKDLQHTAGYTADGQDPQKTGATIAFIDSHHWFGIKAVVYNAKDGRSVQIEQWVDEHADNHWKKILAYVDDGNWGGGHPNCGGTDHTVVTWGGPIAVFRSDHLLDFDIQHMSVREIEAP